MKDEVNFWCILMSSCLMLKSKNILSKGAQPLLHATIIWGAKAPQPPVLFCHFCLDYPPLLCIKVSQRDAYLELCTGVCVCREACRLVRISCHLKRGPKYGVYKGWCFSCKFIVLKYITIFRPFRHAVQGHLLLLQPLTSLESRCKSVF